jgi:hypothetical protein
VRRALIATVALACHGGGGRAAPAPDRIPKTSVVSSTTQTVTRLSTDGKIVRLPYTSFQVNAPVEIDGVPCGIGKIDLWASGKLRACGIVPARTVLGVPLASGYVMLSPEGAIEAGTLSADHLFGTFMAKAGTPFHFNTDGTFGGGTSIGPMKLDGVACGPGVVALEKGVLESCFLDGDQTIDDVPLAGGTEMHRWQTTGKLRLGTLAAPWNGQNAGETVQLKP